MRDQGREKITRLRERFTRTGPGGFDATELLELLLSYSSRGATTERAERLMARFGGLRGVLDAPLNELVNVDGLSRNSAILLKMVTGLGSEYLRERVEGTDVVCNKDDALDYVRLLRAGETDDALLTTICLNGRNEVMATETLHTGRLRRTVVYPRRAIEAAFRHRASSLIFIHHRPHSGAAISGEDLVVTKILESAAAAVGLTVHDYIVAGSDGTVSAREAGRMAAGSTPQAMAAEVGCEDD